jgi:MoxR-like ATPase
MEHTKKELDEESDGSLYRTILVTPLTSKGSNSQEIWKSAKRQRTVSINLRHLQTMISHLSPNATPFDLVDKPLELQPSAITSHGLDKQILGLEGVHQLALLAIGMKRSRESTSELTGADVNLALSVLGASSQYRNSWNPTAQSASSPSRTPFEASGALSVSSEARNFDKLKAKCDQYEKKLFHGIVRPQDIHTTFNAIHAPPSTIEALRTLTSLSLLRPEAFTYGVLKLESIPGLLLYGPPGTGKTLLAKAVAKESGATVLSISGSEVNDMFVGESEKNVRAIFSLARKLSPCVVFIDEADSLFGTRAMSRGRPSHRDTINQFLREWDGMNDMSVFLLVATNRPFDLDDAVLRRLPRRLLVDLPKVDDRAQILQIHLRDEALDPSVSIPDLATQTPFYSGSDLRSLCVAAALACVREENALAAAAAATAEDHTAYRHAAKRTLHRRHFEQALGEISASVSEDMASLTAIKKFDEQFGDRKGRKKRSTLGFGQQEVREEMARVRA